MGTKTFGITAFVYEAGLVFIGCILAFKTRNMCNDFGEAKQLIFSMYNIAFVGIILTFTVFLADLSGSGYALLQTVAVFWATTVSSAAFVFPRLVQLRQRQSNTSVNSLKFSSSNVNYASSKMNVSAIQETLEA